MTDRVDPPLAADERTALGSWLDFHRATVRLKCERVAVTDERRRVLPSTGTTLAGVVSHLRWVEYFWFEVVMLGGPDDGPWSATEPDADFFPAPDVPLAQLLDEYDAQCARSRAVTAALDLDAVGKSDARAGTTLRWVLLHMIEETARHNGHLDAVRELLDGVTGE
jgi:uncharacterized damage-inducible protein DinB